MIRKLATLVTATAILAGAYAYTFGVPAQVQAMIANVTGVASDTASETATPVASGAPAAGPGGGAGRGPGRGSRATTVVTTALEMQPYETVLNAIGTASALRSVNVVTESAGTVVEANLLANREVEVGEVLVRFDARTEALNLEIAQAELDQARDTVTRYERLRQSGSSTITDVTLTEARVKQRLAEAAVGLAQIALDDRTIRAPIAGRLGLSDVDVGDALSANSTIASIDQADALLIEFELPERAIGMLAKAKEVLASTSTFTGRVFTANIVSFDSRIDSVTRSVTVKAQIDNEQGLLWPGMTFSVRLTQESDPMAALPSTAITWSRAGSSVWIDQEGTAVQVPVTIMFRQNETVWIEADIPEGTMVVTEGAQKLRTGAKISTGREERRGGGRPGAGRPGDAEGQPAASGERPQDPAVPPAAPAAGTGDTVQAAPKKESI